MRKDKLRDKELSEILENGDLDSNARLAAIKSLVDKNYVLTSKYTEQANELTKVQGEFESYKQTKMTDEEKQQEAIKEAKAREEKTSKMLSQLFAENVFAKAGFKENDYKEIIPDIIQPDAEATKSIAEKICNSMLNQKKAIEKEIEKKIAAGQKKPDASEDEEDVTIDDYTKLLNEAIEKNDFVKQAHYTRLIQELNQK